jgi:hypothetical protein
VLNARPAPAPVYLQSYTARDVNCRCRLAITEGGDLSFLVTATCGQPYAQLSSRSLRFKVNTTSTESLASLLDAEGKVALGPVQQLQLSNTGSLPLEVHKYTTPPGLPPLHIISPPLPLALEPGASCQLGVRWDVRDTLPLSGDKQKLSSTLELHTNHLRCPTTQLNATLERIRPVVSVQGTTQALQLFEGKTMARTLCLQNSGNAEADVRVWLEGSPLQAPAAKDAQQPVVNLQAGDGSKASSSAQQPLQLKLPAFRGKQELTLSIAAPEGSAGQQVEAKLMVEVNDLDLITRKPRVQQAPVNVRVHRAGKQQAHKKPAGHQPVGASQSLPAGGLRGIMPDMGLLLSIWGPSPQLTPAMACMHPVISSAALQQPELLPSLMAVYAGLCAARDNVGRAKQVMLFIHGMAQGTADKAGHAPDKLPCDLQEWMQELLKELTAVEDDAHKWQLLMLAVPEWFLPGHLVDKYQAHQGVLEGIQHPSLKECTCLVAPDPIGETLLAHLSSTAVPEPCSLSSAMSLTSRALTSLLPAAGVCAVAEPLLLVLQLASGATSGQECLSNLQRVWEPVSDTCSSKPGQWREIQDILRHVVAAPGSPDQPLVQLLCGPDVWAVLSGLLSDDPKAVLSAAQQASHGIGAQHSPPMLGQPLNPYQVPDLALSLLGTDAQQHKIVHHLLCLVGAPTLWQPLSQLGPDTTRHGSLVAAIEAVLALTCSVLSSKPPAAFMSSQSELLQILRSERTQQALEQYTSPTDFEVHFVTSCPPTFHSLVSTSPGLQQALSATFSAAASYCSGTSSHMHPASMRALLHAAQEVVFALSGDTLQGDAKLAVRDGVSAVAQLAFAACTSAGRSINTLEVLHACQSLAQVLHTSTSAQQALQGLEGFYTSPSPVTALRMMEASCIMAGNQVQADRLREVEVLLTSHQLAPAPGSQPPPLEVSLLGILKLVGLQRLQSIARAVAATSADKAPSSFDELQHRLELCCTARPAGPDTLALQRLGRVVAAAARIRRAEEKESLAVQVQTVHAQLQDVCSVLQRTRPEPVPHAAQSVCDLIATTLLYLAAPQDHVRGLAAVYLTTQVAALSRAGLLSQTEAAAAEELSGTASGLEGTTAATTDAKLEAASGAHATDIQQHGPALDNSHQEDPTAASNDSPQHDREPSTADSTAEETKLPPSGFSNRIEASVGTSDAALRSAQAAPGEEAEGPPPEDGAGTRALPDNTGSIAMAQPAQGQQPDAVAAASCEAQEVAATSREGAAEMALEGDQLTEYPEPTPKVIIPAAVMEPAGVAAGGAASTPADLLSDQQQQQQQQQMHDVYDTIKRTVDAVSPALRSAGDKLALTLESSHMADGSHTNSTAMGMIEAVHQLQPLVGQMASAYAASRTLLQALNSQAPAADLSHINYTLLQLLKDVGAQTGT